MIPEVNEIDGATEVNEDKHLVHGNKFKTSKKNALKAPEKFELEVELSRLGNLTIVDAERKLHMIIEEHLYGVGLSQSSIIPLNGPYFDMPRVSFHVAHPLQYL
ncbi:hypothetical protein PVL29_016904 [Vitis rotundifolia]|uniref:Uncharacterized protein n=1 Tax=Vitis rotundifolia TaxID=103349 RepID=A0AA38Z9B0_VITRO|nr:hypothetical protein PVL29_016904 [Vitis rotundifolia]